MIITTTQLQNNFEKYLKVLDEEDVIITSNGKRVARLISCRGDASDSVINEGSAEYSCSGMEISYEEFLEISQNSDNRYEYIDGEIYLLASPFYAHQKAVREIFGEFISWFRDRKCEPLTSPFDVTLYKNENNINVVQPDIMVICDTEKIDDKGRYNGTPSIVVEVLSESTRRKDLIKKLDLYMASGVKEYWIVNTDSKEIYIYTFSDGNIENMITFKGNERATSIIFEGLGIELAYVFQ